MHKIKVHNRRQEVEVVHSCGLKAEQLDKTRKGLKTCKQHNKPK